MSCSSCNGVPERSCVRMQGMQPNMAQIFNSVQPGWQQLLALQLASNPQMSQAGFAQLLMLQHIINQSQQGGAASQAPLLTGLSPAALAGMQLPLGAPAPTVAAGVASQATAGTPLAQSPLLLPQVKSIRIDERCSCHYSYEV